ncbi:MAG: phosphoserine phosphatase [Thermoproteota archaeon]|nr:phosphoserine phosphatase [Thermoproteota archaeon]
MKIRVFDSLNLQTVEELRKITDVIEDGWDFDIAIVRSATHVTKEFVDRAKRLKLVVRAGVGLDNVDLTYCKKRKIEVRNTAEATSTSVAELVFAHLLSIARKTVESTEKMKKGSWLKEEGFELAGKTLGIVGYGRIGREVAKRARAFGMNVVVYDPFVKTSDAFLLSFNELLHVSDVITLHLPLNESTRNMINREAIKKMKDGAILINTSRGDVINEVYLYEALLNGKIGYAGLDVFQNEPTPSQQLLTLDNVILTSHIGASTVDAQDRVGEAVVEQVKDFINNLVEYGQNLYVITISCEDRPGITAALTSILLKWEVPILDAEQATIQGLLALSFLTQVSPSYKKDLEKDLLEKAKEMNLNLKIIPYKQTRKRRDKILYVLTCLSHIPRGEILAHVSNVLSHNKANIETIRQFHGRDLTTLELLIDVSDTSDIEKLKQELMNAGEALSFDVALQKENVFRKSKRLIVFDVDSTLIDMEIIDEIAKVAGIQKELSTITDATNKGKLDFRQSLQERVGMLKDLSFDALKYVASTIQLSEGARELITLLKQMGFKIAIISGGFTFFTDILKKELELDYAFANQLAIKNKHLTGELEGPIIDGSEKVRIMMEIAEREKISLDQVVAVGNGANDVEMLSKAGLGIAFHPTGDLKKYVKGTIFQRNLRSILYMLGLNEEDVE